MLADQCYLGCLCSINHLRFMPDILQIHIFYILDIVQIDFYIVQNMNYHTRLRKIYFFFLQESKHMHTHGMIGFVRRCYF